ncbi:MAG TPA: urea carboxylase-associated family protein [Alphaproteobacteria bacterium]|nr:urea carboxylase-associated family protein [Alphaproteobacteria bacterium]
MIRLAARTALAFSLRRNQLLSVVNTYGSQVVDAWAFAAADPTEFMSMEHSRVHCHDPTPRVGTRFVTNRRRPILEITGDTSPGIHDWFLAACDRWRYELLGCDGTHANCTDNLHAALATMGVSTPVTPAPFNLFENAPFLPGGSVEIAAPLSRPGDRVDLLLHLDALVVLSACPQDMVPTNGADMTPRDVEIRIDQAA